MRKQIIDMLEEYVTPHKVATIDEVLSQRTRHLTVVLEDIYHAQNASAVMRTCDCFGIQDLYITQRLHDYEVNPNVVRGASKWVSQYKYEREEESTAKCFLDLKKKNYRIVGTTPSKEVASIHELDISQKTAIVFGTELEGLTEYAKEQVDELVHIPMYGFTESFNISVSAALLLQELVSRLKSSNIVWQLTEDEKEELKLEWYSRIVKRSDIHINNFMREHSQNSKS
ncbi:TrmH family RNA methyltransferase [Roseivirga sp. 4D4]|uniref:TrmH family RNA methyltransferase n=1 Tax=Roseivirga sp. 4D4 TaxID=1889784 RepID=UPI002100ACF4|nr:RNA methyltransferase [Roseivirga sp. 4D4]